jgi:cobalt-zinc-cadmium resistance protein CzcA
MNHRNFHIVLFLIFYLASANIISLAQDTNSIPLSMQMVVNNALNNNLSIKNAKLHIAQADLQRSSSFDFNPTEIIYKQGELYSNEPGKSLEINQNFGSILAQIQTLKKSKISHKLQSTAYELIVNEITADAKSAFIYWQYKYKVNSLLEEEKDMYQKLADIADLKYKLGEINQLKKSILITSFSEISSQYLMSADELVIAENKLKQIMMTEGDFIPSGTEPELYIIDRQFDTVNYSGSTQLNYYHLKQLLLQSQVNVKQAEYFPDLKIGFFKQNIGDLNNLYGYEIGLAIPLWIPKQQSDIKQAKIESEIALNDYESEKQSIFFETENLLFELNKCFRQIRHYEENALKESDILLHTAQIQLNAEEIEYTEFLQSVSLAYQIKLAYYLAKLNYNLTAIQLESYGK